MRDPTWKIINDGRYDVNICGKCNHHKDAHIFAAVLEHANELRAHPMKLKAIRAKAKAARLPNAPPTQA